MDRVRHLHTTVQRAYTEAAQRPQDEHPFPVGRSFAESKEVSLKALATHKSYLNHYLLYL